MRCVALGMVVALVGCKSADSGQIAAAAIGVGAAVAAAAINRAATDECWGACEHGTVCDPESGVCVPDEGREIVRPAAQSEERWYPCDPERLACGPNEWLVCDLVGCEWYRCDETNEVCDPRPGPACGAGEECALRLADGERPTDGQLGRDPCRGLCLGTERCVVADGVADCVAAASR